MSVEAATPGASNTTVFFCGVGPGSGKASSKIRLPRRRETSTLIGEPGRRQLVDVQEEVVVAVRSANARHASHLAGAASAALSDDGLDDGVIALTLITPLFIHLLLAVIVDFDIIMVRGFDRVSAVLPFHARIEHAMGYTHRTILLSIGVGSLAFIIGSIVDLPVLIYFCWHSFLGMVGLYISLFTLFLGAFVMHQKNQLDCKVEKLDFLCRLYRKNALFCYCF